MSGGFVSLARTCSEWLVPSLSAAPSFALILGALDNIMVPDRICLPTVTFPPHSLLSLYIVSLYVLCLVLEHCLFVLSERRLSCRSPCFSQEFPGSLRAVEQILEPGHMEAAFHSTGTLSRTRALTGPLTKPLGQMSDETSTFTPHTALWAARTLNNRHR